MATSSVKPSAGTTRARSGWRSWLGRSRSGGDGRQVECAVCFEPLPVAEALIVGSVAAAEDGGPGGTAMVVEYHPGCVFPTIA